MNKKSKKGKYQTAMGNSSLALTMDVLRDSYRLREKMFPAVFSFNNKSHIDDSRIEYASLSDLAKAFENRKDFPDIYRYDFDGILIKRHVFREV